MCFFVSSSNLFLYEIAHTDKWNLFNNQVICAWLQIRQQKELFYLRMSAKFHFCFYKSDAFSQNQDTFIFWCYMTSLVQNRVWTSLKVHCTWDLLSQDCLKVHTVIILTQFSNLMEAELNLCMGNNINYHQLYYVYERMEFSKLGLARCCPSCTTLPVRSRKKPAAIMLSAVYVL